MITVVKKGSKPSSTAIRFYCGRGTPLGNPDRMRGTSIRERDRVCDKYEEEFGTPEQVAECRRILSEAKKQDIELECFCSPKRCHCDTVKSYLDHLQSEDVI